MCLIVDTNLAGSVFGTPPHVDFRPIVDWLISSKKNGTLVVGGQLSTELNKIESARRFIRSLSQAGRASVIPSGKTEEETEIVRGLCESDDPHVIALARLSGARILCSHDTDLHSDFRNHKLVNKPRGHIYQSKEHSHLLLKYGHTEACPVRKAAG